MQFNERCDIGGTVEFIQKKACKVVALQFPDELLKDAACVVEEVSRRLADYQLDTRVSFLTLDCR